MNSLVQEWRRRVPDDPRRDAQILVELGDKYPDQLERFPDAKEQYLQIKDEIREAMRPSAGEEFSAGVSRGVDSLQEVGVGAAALAAGALAKTGLPTEGVRDKLLQKAAEQQEQAAEKPAFVPSYRDIKSGKDLVSYISGQAGNVLPSLAEAGVVAGISAAIGGAAGTAAAPGPGTAAGSVGGAIYGVAQKQAIKGLIKKTVRAEIKAQLKDALEAGTTKALSEEVKALVKREARTKIQKYATNLGITINSFAVNAGETYTSLAENPSIGPDKAVNLAVFGGAVKAVPDSILPSYVAGKFLKGVPDEAKDQAKKQFYGYFTRLLQEASKTVPAEALGEGFQEFVDISVERYADPNLRDQPWSRDLTDRIIDNAAAGGLGGLMMGPAAAIPGGRPAPQEQQDQAEPVALEDQGVDPALNYQIPEERKAHLTSVAQEAAGRPLEDQPPEVAEIYSSGNANEIEFYKSEVRRLRTPERETSFGAPDSEAEAWSALEDTFDWFDKGDPAELDAKAHAAATSPLNTQPEPTEQQKESGKYTKGHIKVAGLDISIENPEGSKRRPEWPTLTAHYGDINGTVGADGDKLDVFVKPGTAENWSGPVFVVNQNGPDGSFDEHKVVLGSGTQEDAVQVYLSNYQEGQESRIHSVAEFSQEDFKEWSKRKGGKKSPAPTAALTKARRAATGDIPVSQPGEPIDDDFADAQAAELRVGKTPAPSVSPTAQEAEGGAPTTQANTTPTTQQTGKSVGVHIDDEIRRLEKEVESAQSRLEKVGAEAGRFESARQAKVRQDELEVEITKLQRQLKQLHGATRATREAEIKANLDSLVKQLKVARKEAADTASSESIPASNRAISRLSWLTRKLNNLKERRQRGDTGSAFSDQDIDWDSTDYLKGESGRTETGETFPQFYESTESTDAGKALNGGYSVSLGEQLTSQAATKKISRQKTSRLTAFLTPEGSVHLLGTFKRGRTKNENKDTFRERHGHESSGFFVSNPDGGASIPLKKAMEMGWKPIASIRSAYPISRPAWSYATREQFENEVAGPARARKTAESAVSSQIESNIQSTSRDAAQQAGASSPGIVASGAFGGSVDSAPDLEAGETLSEEPEQVEGDRIEEAPEEESPAVRAMAAKSLVDPHDAVAIYDEIHDRIDDGQDIDDAISDVVTSSMHNSMRRIVARRMANRDERMSRLAEIMEEESEVGISNERLAELQNERETLQSELIQESAIELHTLIKETYATHESKPRIAGRRAFSFDLVQRSAQGALPQEEVRDESGTGDGRGNLEGDGSSRLGPESADLSRDARRGSKRARLALEEELAADLESALSESQGELQDPGLSYSVDGPGWVLPGGRAFLPAEGTPAVRYAGLSFGGHVQAFVDYANRNPEISAALAREIADTDVDPNDIEQFGSAVESAAIKMGYVRVGGDRAVLYITGRPTPAQIRFVKNAAIEQEAELILDRGPGMIERTLYSPVDRFRVEQQLEETSSNPQDVATAFNEAVDRLRAEGVDMKILRRSVSGIVGNYKKSFDGDEIVKAVTIAMRDASKPTTSDYTTLLHEVGHLVFNDLPADRQLALQNAISRASDTDLRIEGFSSTLTAEEYSAQVTNEERMVESVARELVAEGFSPSESETLASQLWNMAKEILMEITFAIIEASGFTPTPGLAKAYVQRRVESMLRGDVPYSVRTFLGGVKNIVKSSSQEFEDAQFIRRYVNRNRRVDFVGAEETAASPDLDNAALFTSQVAAQNEVMDSAMEIYNAWHDAGDNTSNLTFEQFLESGNFIKLSSLPAEVIQRVVARDPSTKVDARLSDVKNPAARKQSAAVAYKILNKASLEMAKRRRDAEWLLSPSNSNSLSSRRERASQRIRDLTTKYEDADLMLREALRGDDSGNQSGIISLIERMNEDADSLKLEARSAGALTQAIRSLDKTTPLRQYKQAMNRLFKRIVGEDAGKFTDILIEVGKMDVDWGNLSIPELTGLLQLSAGENAVLKPLADDKAMLSLIASFAKTNSHVLDLLGMSRSKAVSERKAANEAIAHALKSHTQASQEARRLANKLPTLGRRVERIINKLEKVKRENRDIMDQIVREESFIEFHVSTLPRMKRRLAKLEHEIGAVPFEWEATHGADYMVPGKPGDSAGSVEKSTKRLKLNPNGMLKESVRSDLAKMGRWLDSVPEEQRGATWNMVQRQYDKLSWMDLNWVHQSIQNSWINKILAPLPDRLRFVGTPAARSAAKRIEQFSFWWHSKAHPARELGTKWEAVEGDAMRLLGYKDRHAFQGVFLRHGMSYIEKRQDILAGQSDSSRAADIALQELRKFFEREPGTSEAIRRPGAWAALEKYYRQTAINSAWLEKNRQEMGIKIRDKGDGYDIYRDAIGASPFHVMRGISDEAKSIFEHMQNVWQTPLNFRQAAEEDPEALMESLAARFDQRVWRDFVVPLVNRTGRSVFYAPNDGGESRFASRENVIKAAENSGGQFMAFARNLYDLEGGTGSDVDFAVETLDTFQSFFNLLQSIHQEVAHADANYSPLPRKFLANARKSEEFPAEWLDYLPYDIHNMRQVTKFQSMHASFGRDMGAWNLDAKTAIDEQTELATEFSAIQRMFPTLTGKKLEREMKAEVEKRGKDWTIMKQANRNRQTMQQAEVQMRALLSMSRDRPMEILPLQEIFGTLAGLAVSGPGTALTDTIAIFEQPFRRFGFSTEAFRQIGGSVSSLAKVTMGSLYQAFGKQAKFDSEYMQIAMRLGLYDDDAKLTLKERLHSAFTEEVANTNILMRGAVHAARATRVITTTGIGRQQGDVAYPTFKPHSVFMYQAQLVHLAEAFGWWKRYESYVAKAVQHFNENQADLDNTSFSLTKEIIGLNGRAWDYMREGAARFGLDFDQVARDAHRRRKSDPHAQLLTDDQYRALAQMAQNEITLDSSLSTRPPSLMTNPTLNLANPLLGWAISKGYDAWRGFRQPDGRKTWNGFKTGLMAYAAILPIALAWAYMREEYDEQIIGRKQNVLKLGQGNAFAALLDMTARTGTFGILGELPNSIVNVDTNRELSVDNRVFFVNTVLGLKRALESWVHQDGVTDWQTVGRPLTQALGGSGYLQYADAINNLFGLDTQEARIAKRIGVNNYLRAAGRAIGLDVRTSRGMRAIPTRVKPYVGQMVLAAMNNDAAEFRSAYNKARKAAREIGKEDPDKHVLQSFQAYHPLRYVFRTTPTEGEYRRLLREIGDGSGAVGRSVSLMNHYTEQIGGSGTTGKKAKKPASNPMAAAVSFGR